MICCTMKFYVHINIVKRCCNTVADVIGIVQMTNGFIEPIIICMGKIEVEDVAAQNTITVIRKGADDVGGIYDWIYVLL